MGSDTSREAPNSRAPITVWQTRGLCDIRASAIGSGAISAIPMMTNVASTVTHGSDSSSGIISGTAAQSNVIAPWAGADLGQGSHGGGGAAGAPGLAVGGGRARGGIAGQRPAPDQPRVLAERDARRHAACAPAAPQPGPAHRAVFTWLAPDRPHHLSG